MSRALIVSATELKLERHQGGHLPTSTYDPERPRESKELASSHPEVIVPTTGAKLRPPRPKMGFFQLHAWPSPV